MSDSTCLTISEHWEAPLWLEYGGFIPVLLGIAAMFWAISFVCEEFGVPGLTALCKRNKFSDALTGSIFIGTGLSLPVFFIALAGLFATNSAIGVGAVVGGNLFNHLFTMASSIYVCPSRTMKLDALVYTREMLIYFLTCLMVLWVVQNGDLRFAFTSSFDRKQWESCLSIQWKYSLPLVLAYIGYCFIDGNFDYIQSWFNKKFYGIDENLSTDSDNNSSSRQLTAVENADLENVNPSDATSSENAVGADGSLVTAVTESLSVRRRESNPNEVALQSDSIIVMVNNERKEIPVLAKSMLDSVFDKGESYLTILDPPANYKDNVIAMGFYFLTYPLRYGIYLTIPDVRRPGSESYAILSLSIVIVWLGVLSYVLTISLTLIGNWWHISSAVMGITIAAWASNFPAHWSSIVVSRHGYGDVSCCNCLGSNTFNNLIGLGLPWLLYNLVYRERSYDALRDDGVAISVFLMMGTTVLQYVVVLASNWVLKEWMIYPMMILYFAEIAFLAYFYSAMV